MVNENTERTWKSTPVFEELEEFVRQEIQQKLQSLLDEEVEEFLGRLKYERRSEGEAGYRNGYAPPRKLSMMSGTIKVRRPKLRDLDEKFESVILPRFKRKSKEIESMLPELYLHGLSLGDFDLALRGLLGNGAPLSASSIERLKSSWQEEFEVWRNERLDDFRAVYLWADGIYVKAGFEKEKAALLVVIGVDVEGRKKVLSVEPGYRESSESWACVLRDLRERGMNAPRLMIADGNLGIWSALSEVFPQTREQRCWNHKIRNVLDCLPLKHRKDALKFLHRICFAKTRQACEAARREFEKAYSRQYPKAVGKLRRDWEKMIAFFDFPHEHWQHIRTSNVVESPFAAVRLRTTVARRFKKVMNAVAVIWKILLIQENAFRKLRGFRKLQDVYDGVVYVNGNKSCSIAA